MELSDTGRRRFTTLKRAVIETALLIFLLFSVRLMGEFTSTSGQGKSLALALSNIFTGANLLIATVSALIGYFILKLIRKRM
jgi:uncharacterized protein (DUF1800 family)